MPRNCTVCLHSERDSIDQALVAGEAFRSIAKRCGTSATALFRHKAEHLPVHLVQAAEAESALAADDLFAQLRALQVTTGRILKKAETAGRLGTAVMAIREQRGNIELLAKLQELAMVEARIAALEAAQTAPAGRQ